jgi:hypothetical protein
MTFVKSQFRFDLNFRSRKKSSAIDLIMTNVNYILLALCYICQDGFVNIGTNIGSQFEDTAIFKAWRIRLEKLFHGH